MTIFLKWFNIAHYSVLTKNKENSSKTLGINKKKTPKNMLTNVNLLLYYWNYFLNKIMWKKKTVCMDFCKQKWQIT